MAPLEPRTWSLAVWWLWALGTYYLIGFFVHWFRFRQLEADLEAKAPGAVDAWNDGITGWPAMGYAKMMGKKKLED